MPGLLTSDIMRIVVALLFMLAAFSDAAAHDIDLTRLPLGDGKISDHPKAGWLWACRVDRFGRGAQVKGPWIGDDGTFDMTAKAVVEGQVSWPHQFRMSVEGDVRVFTSNDLPNHPTGVFPVAPSDGAYAIDPNPNRIRPQNIRVEVPLDPVLGEEPQCTPNAIGLLLTGVVLFNALDAMGRDAVAHEVQDGCQGHPQQHGAYHYHSVTTCLEDERLPGGHSALVGYALDGFGIYGRYGEGGQSLSSKDLDECHGHTHAIEWNGRVVEMYHYHGTWDFPYTIGCMRGLYDPRHVWALISPPQEPAWRRTVRRIRGLF